MTSSTSTSDETCQETNYIGDGYCDDFNNLEDCDFDGGDCCGPNVLTDYCFDCTCKQLSTTEGRKRNIS